MDNANFAGIRRVANVVADFRQPPFSVGEPLVNINRFRFTLATPFTAWLRSTQNSHGVHSTMMPGFACCFSLATPFSAWLHAT